MVTNFNFAAELVEKLKSRITAELSSIVSSLSTVDIPLSSLAGSYVGFFDPVAKTVRPALFLVPDTITPEQGEGTLSSYAAKLHVNVYFVMARDGGDEEKSSLELYNYVKALVVFVNGHLDEYSLAEDITFYEALGADRSQRWASLELAIETEIRL